MISHTVSISGTSPQTMATFVYDGNGNRVQQTDSSGSQPTTTTYINDVVGLTQVLVADDGTSQVYNLFGLDLIAQDDGIDTRTMLADGLGSVRTELVGGVVESTSTYDPYGNLLQQTGASGTTYGYAGEQQDSSTGLLYLRARYYNPALRSFMGRDPWKGNLSRPQSMNGWGYVENNPINLFDPSGLIPKRFPEQCRTVDSYPAYGDCVREAYGVSYFHGDYEAFVIEELKGQVPEYNGCYEGPVPYRAPGYVEGFSGALAIITYTGVIGREVVYDFATMERNRYKYTIDSDFYRNPKFDEPGKEYRSRRNSGDFPYPFSTGGLSLTFAWYYGEVIGFRNWSVKGINEYEGRFGYLYVGASVEPSVGVAAGYMTFWGMPDSSIKGHTFYESLVFGWGLPLDSGFGATYYEEWEGKYESYFTEEGRKKSVDSNVIFADLKRGLDGLDIGDVGIGDRIIRNIAGRHMVHKYSKIFNGIHYDSYQE